MRKGVEQSLGVHFPKKLHRRDVENTEHFSEGRVRFLISRRGEAQAVILSVEDYLRSIVKRPEAITDLQKVAKESGASKFTMEEIDTEIAAYRKGL